jgi:hypothetical protein
VRRRLADAAAARAIRRGGDVFVFPGRHRSARTRGRGARHLDLPLSGAPDSRRRAGGVRFEQRFAGGCAVGSPPIASKAAAPNTPSPRRRRRTLAA